MRNHFHNDFNLKIKHNKCRELGVIKRVGYSAIYAAASNSNLLLRIDKNICGY